MMKFGVAGKDDFWKKIVESSLAAIYVVDMDELRYVYVNKVVERATGYTKEELYSMNVFDLAYKEDIPKIMERIKAFFEGKSKRIFFEARYVTKSGEVRWAWGYLMPMKYGGKLYAIGNWIDVTKVKELDLKLRESEEFYRTLIEESLTPVYLIQDGKLKYVNKAFEDVTGYKREEVYELDPIEVIIHPEHREEVRRRYLERERGKRDVETYSWKIITKNGEVRWVTAKPNRIIYKGKPAVVATVVDTTEIHKLNEELMLRNEFLRLLNKVMRHDILNELAVIRGAIEVGDERMLQEALSRIDRIVELIDVTRALEEAGGEIKSVNLSEVVKEIVDEMNKMPHLREIVDFDVDVSDIDVAANEGLKPVIYNIIQNSILHSERRPVKIRIHAENNGRFAVIKICDDGIGIPDEIKDRIFEEGFSTKDRKGLGLYIVKKMVEGVYGGRVEVADNKPSGAVFIITIPKARS